ncbi:hypothetical protein ACH9L7_09260 [Haloferax sp. S1W]|uniref:DUF7310 family coiled-coil domain-containing protein n=1 Tax=Haloferax sp. S1W TaxID=3377110 RepID=UPI0037CAA3B6
MTRPTGFPTDATHDAADATHAATNATQSATDTDRSSTDSHRTADLAARLDAVERTLTGTDAPVSDLEDLAAVEARVADLEATVETLTDRIDDIDAATQAIRGYLGGIRAVNESVERRADAALAKAESLEAALVDESDAARQQSAIARAATVDDRESGTIDGPDPDAVASEDALDADADAERGLTARLRDVL